MWIESKYIWQNWEFIDWDNSTQHTVIHALHYWTSVFEGIRFYSTSEWPRCFRLNDHIKRLFYSMQLMEMESKYTIKDICEITNQLIQKNWIYSWYVRPIVWYGYWKMWLNPKWANVNTSISVWPWWKYLSKDPISVLISSFIRPHPQSIDHKAKVGWYYVNSFLSNNEAQKAWYDEALLLDHQWNIAEWPGENIFFIKNNTLHTPKTSSILPWITRDTIINWIAQDMWFDVEQKDIKLEEMYLYDEAFFVGTAAEISPIWGITDQKWKKVNFGTNKWYLISKYYQDIVHWKIEKYSHWVA